MRKIITILCGVGLASSCAMEILGSAEAVSSSSVTLSWEAVAGIERYEVYVDGVYREWTEALTISLELLESGVEHEFEVIASGDAGRRTVLGPMKAKTPAMPSDPALIDPLRDLEYLGAFRFPSSSGAASSWGFQQGDLAFQADGDPGNTDAFPGSLFAPGNSTQRLVAEIGIPAPVVSASRNPDELPQATTLQEFGDARCPDMPSGSSAHPPALEYVPEGAGAVGNRLYTCYADNYQVGGQRLNSYGSASLTASAFDPRGAWYVGPLEAYSSPDYMAATSYIASLATPLAGHRLAAGGSRYGSYHWGPTLVAYTPWTAGLEAPANGASLAYTPLLMYDRRSDEDRWSAAGAKKVLRGAAPNDIWRGGAWVSFGGKSAFAVVGIKGHGDYWYVSGAGPRQSNYRSLMLLYDVRDFEEVAAGTMAPNEPQPYAVLDLGRWLFSANDNDDTWSVEKKGPGGMAFDPGNGLLYIVETKVYGTYEDKPIVHVFRVK